jgi:hypothetical protein
MRNGEVNGRGESSMSKSEKRRAALAGNRAVRELAKAFEVAGLNDLAAFNLAARVVCDARLKVESEIEKLRRRQRHKFTSSQDSGTLITSPSGPSCKS